jgi:hypothetical protein
MNDERQAAAVIGLVVLIGFVGLLLTGLPGGKAFSEMSFNLGDVYVATTGLTSTSMAHWRSSSSTG